MKNMLRSLFFTTFSLLSGALSADADTVKKALAGFLPDVEIDAIRASEMKGLYEVVVGPKIFYVSEDAHYLIQGRLIDLPGRKDLTEAKLADARVESLAKVGIDNMIVFKPKEPKFWVSVFTDIDCGYCRKLHSEINQYLEAGIGVRYLFFPRAGMGSDSYHKAVSVWCADDRNAALTAAKNGGSVESKTCENPVSEHMALAAALGANGTPMIVTGKGNVLPGYVGADRLLEYLKFE